MAVRRFGRIVFVASDTLWSPPGGEFLPYVGSKGAMLGVVRTLVVDLGTGGIAVTAVPPGLTDMPIARSVNDAGQIEAVVATQAMKPDDAAHAVAFLASDGTEARPGRRRRLHHAVDPGAALRRTAW
ncbi:hypothetical protein GCM10022222_39730 [Amycolatopsis ultiminotia]|uniref:Uncharacterized protein n=2 Tax=Amycolatopsis ultiminotia TaxID=543629 RepID=A0ABP6WIH8_9PSEU